VDGFVVVMDWETLAEAVASLLCHLTLLPLNCPALQHGGCSLLVVGRQKDVQLKAR
jgi:hypothetical protein